MTKPLCTDKSVKTNYSEFPNSSISFHIPAVPVPQPRPRATVFAGHAHVYEAGSEHSVHAFKATCRHAARAAYSGPPLEGPLTLTLEFVLPRPQAMRWKSKPMPRVAHAKKPDIDNLVKSLLDSLGGLVWLDDAQIAELTVRKYVAAGTEQPGVTVEVRQS